MTVNHKEIRRWAAAHGAIPAQYLPLHHDGEPAQLQFVFPNQRRHDAALKPISWEHFFATFDLMELALQYELEDESNSSTKQNQLIHRKTPQRTVEMRADA